jgi:hypothetical protein
MKNCCIDRLDNNYLFFYLDESPYRRILQRQITDLILVYEKYCTDISVDDYTIEVYGYILKFFENLKHLPINGSHLQHYPPLVLRDFPLTTFSSALNKLCVRVRNFEDCLALLDGRLKQLTTLIIVIIKMEYNLSNVYNTVSLYLIRLIFSFEKQIMLIRVRIVFI